jgi:hypothetical protein
VAAMWKCFWEWLGSLPPSSASFVGSLTGAAFGLAAIILGALFNAHLNRRRDDRLRKIEARTLAVALKAELAGLKQSLIENADGLEKSSDGFLVPDIATSVRIMPEMLSKLGLLDPDTVQKVVAAHGVLERYAEHCLRIDEGAELQKTPSRRGLISMAGGSAKKVARLNRTLAAVLDEALIGLDKYLES